MLVFRQCVFGLLLCIPLRVVSSTFAAQEVSSPPDRQQVESFLSLAAMAAENGFAELSFSAVRKALGAGPPEFARRPTITAPQMPAGTDSLSLRRLPVSLHSLVSLWQAKSFDSAAISETLQAIILPESLPDRVFRYCLEPDTTSPETAVAERSVGLLWLKSSVLAGRQQQCLQTLERRLLSRESALDANILILQLAAEIADAELQQICVKRLREYPELHPGPSQIAVLVQLLSSLLNTSDSQLRELSRNALDKVIPAGRGQTFPDPYRTLLRSTSLDLAAERLGHGQTEIAIQLISAADWFAEQVPVKDQDFSQVRQLLRHHEQVARLLLTVGTLEQAADRLRMIRDLQQEFSVSEPMGIITDSVFAFRPLSADVRFEILASQLVTNSSIPIAAAGFQWAPTTPPPDVQSQLPEQLRARWFPGEDGATFRLPEHPLLMLIDSAIECGRLDQLKVRLTELSNQGHWPAMYGLVCLLMKTGAHEEADTRIRELFKINPVGSLTTGDTESLLLSEMLRTSRYRESALRRMLSREILPRLRLSQRNSAALAAAMAPGPPESPGKEPAAAVPTVPTRLHWLSDDSIPERLAVEAPQSGQVTQALISRTGGGRGTLCFPWPLSGEFEFSCTAVTATGPFGGLGYNGISIAGAESARMVRTEPWGNHAPALRSIAFLSPEKPVQLSIRATADQLLFLLDGHPVENVSRRTGHSEVPWLFLTMNGPGAGYWTNFQLTGTIQVPREVRLSEADDLRGWSSRLVQQTQPELRANLPESRPPATPSNRPGGGRAKTDWYWDAGVVTGRRNPSAAIASGFADVAAAQTEIGLLQYQRPMLDGETLAWEFEYLPDSVESSPALGRLLLQIHSSGVQKRWLPTQAMERLLPAVNSMDFPEKESQTFPIRTGWNKASLKMHSGTVTLTLNDQEVSVAAIPPDGDTRPGLFYNRGRTEARVRNIVLSGPWPETVTNADLNELLRSQHASEVPSMALSTAAESRLDLPAELPFLLTAAETAKRLVAMDSNSAVAEAMSWVFPASGAPIRMYAAPAAWLSGDQPTATLQKDSQFPEIIHSPALELFRQCRSPGQFAEIRAQIEKRPALTQQEAYEHDAMLTLLAIYGNEPEAATRLQALTQRTENAVASAIFPPWSALTVAQAAAGNPALRSEALRLLTTLNFPAADAIPSPEPCIACSQTLLSLLRTLQSADANGMSPTAVLQPLAAWIPLRLTTESVADRLPPPLWLQSADRIIQHVSGTSVDLICWPQPLTGDFTMTCTALPVDGKYPVPGYAGVLWASSPDGHQIHEVPIGRGAFFSEILRRPAEPSPARHYRMQMRARTLTLEIDGQIVMTRPVPANAAPWLVFQACDLPGAQIQQCEVTTTAQTTTEILIDTGREMSGWRKPWFSMDAAAEPGSGGLEEWRSSEARLEGTLQSQLSGTHQPSLIQYLRPLPVRASLTYAFFFEPGRKLVHPVIGDDILELHPESGIQRRSLSDMAGNIRAEQTVAKPPESAPASSALPLRPNDWNQMQLVAEAENIVLVLNGQTLGTFPVSVKSSRVFGLFHWSDQTAAAVRDLTLSGDWGQP